MARGIPRGIGFGSLDACGCSSHALDAGSIDILKNRKTWKLLFLQENGFRKNVVFTVEKTNRKDGNDSKDPSCRVGAGANPLSLNVDQFNLI